MIKHIKVVPLVCGIVIGIIAILCIDPEKTVIRKYPNPQNADKMIYKDRNGMCYKYKANKVDCDKNEAKLKDFPLSK